MRAAGHETDHHPSLCRAVVTLNPHNLTSYYSERMDRHDARTLELLPHLRNERVCLYRAADRPTLTAHFPAEGRAMD